jgi:preprotein translocase subunit SecD
MNRSQEIELRRWALACYCTFTAAAASVLPATCAEEQPGASVKHETPAQKAEQTRKPESNLADGLYLVLRSDHDKQKVGTIGATETLVANDFHLLEPAEREPVVYMVLQTKPFIPLILGASPAEDKEEATGKPRLQLQLTEDQKGPLEEFTRAHLGETVAIVIGGDVVTSHKVKSAITGGRLQITRCTKHGCETLFTRLLKDRPGNPSKN